MKKILKKMNVLLDGKQKAKMGGIVVLMIIGAALEACSIGLVIPIITTLLDPEAVNGEGYLGDIYRFLGMKSTSQFTIVMLLVIIAAFVVKNVFLYFQNVVQLRFVYTNQFATSRRMMINFMERPYEYYLNADTSVIQRSITSDVNNMYGLILSSLQLLSEIIMFLVLVIVLMTQDPMMILTIALLLVIVLLVIKCILKPIMIKAGEDNQEYYSGLYKWIDQSVMGIKEIKIANKESYFINEYSKCGAGYVGAVQKYNIYNATPRLLIETVCIAGLVLYLILQIASGKEVAAMITQIGVFAVAAMRLLPSANRINNYLTSISYFEPFFMGVSDNLQEEINDRNVNYDAEAYEARKEIKKLPVLKKIELKDIVYKYPNTDVLIFNHADMEIPVGCSVGVVGTSGAGKTTIIDVLLGLLNIQEGSILADGVEVREHYEEWLKNIGYIPQTIFMIDASIRKNVAFGVPDEEIDDNKVWQALKEAQLDEFVRGLPEGLDTGIGERGIRLSGGQRQALTLLMATMVTPKILLLDEHTAALDPATAKKVLDLTRQIVAERKITCLMVTHNMHQALELGNRTLMMDSGNIILDVSGEKRAGMTVEDLLEQFAVCAGKRLDNDRILFSQVE